MRRRRVTVVEPVIGQRRVPFFERLGAELNLAGVELTVATLAAPGAAATSATSVTPTPTGAVEVPRRTVRVAGRELAWLRLGDLVETSDALVLGQSLRTPEVFRLLVAPRRRGTAVALWGRGRGGAPHRATARRADWFFAPTGEGARRAVERGFPPHRVTVVREAPDTVALTAARAAVARERVRELRERHGLVPGRTALHLGPLDASQRLPFLLAAADLVGRRLPGFRLLVAGVGGGAERSLVESAAEGSECVVRHEAASDEERALLGAVADVLLVPGAVGPRALDSFALGVPVVTVPVAGHGPEFEYLEHRRNALVVHGAAREFADAVVDVLASPDRLAGLGAACLADAARYTVDGMSSRFAAGIEGLLAQRIRSRRVRWTVRQKPWSGLV